MGPGEAIEALVGDSPDNPVHPYENLITGPDGRIPTNLSGGLKARGHPVGGTGLFQIAENYLQITERFPNRDAQVPIAKLGISHSIGGPGNNNYVTVIEAANSRRRRDAVVQPRLHFESPSRRPERATAADLDGANATVEGATTIHVRGSGGAPLHVALLNIDGRRVFAKMDHAPRDEEPLEEVLAGQKVRLLVKDDGDQYFQIPRGHSFEMSRLVEAIRRRVPRWPAGEET